MIKIIFLPHLQFCVLSETVNFAMAANVESGGQSPQLFVDVHQTRLSWCLSKLFRFTVGSCCSRDDPHSTVSGHELNEYTNGDREPLITKDNERTKKSLIKERADQRMKDRLIRHFQDHIRKWSRDKHPRFPWKAGLHLLLVVFVTVQVS